MESTQDVPPPEYSLAQRMAAEAIGIFFLVFVGAGTAAMTLILSQGAPLWGSSIPPRGLTCGWASDLPGGYAAGSYWLIKPPRI